jgi:predicted Zn-dependent protease
MDMDKLVEAYVQLRDAKAEIEERYKEERAPFNRAIADLEALLLQGLDKSGLTSAKTVHGTVYKKITTSAKIIDWGAVLEFATKEDRLDLFERRVNKTVAEEIGDVPGVVYDRVLNINVRRS